MTTYQSTKPKQNITTNYINYLKAKNNRAPGEKQLFDNSVLHYLQAVAKPITAPL